MDAKINSLSTAKDLRRLEKIDLHYFSHPFYRCYSPDFGISQTMDANRQSTFDPFLAKNTEGANISTFSNCYTCYVINWRSY